MLHIYEESTIKQNVACLLEENVIFIGGNVIHISSFPDILLILVYILCCKKILCAKKLR